MTRDFCRDFAGVLGAIAKAQPRNRINQVILAIALHDDRLHKGDRALRAIAHIPYCEMCRKARPLIRPYRFRCGDGEDILQQIKDGLLGC